MRSLITPRETFRAPDPFISFIILGEFLIKKWTLENFMAVVSVRISSSSELN